jgi:predicted NUDIX family NTP pyrophosphohydrolase
MAKVSAGLLMYRFQRGVVETLLVHLGGPFWTRKEEGAWFVPKGEVEPGEDVLAAARREFEEETGLEPPEELIPLGSVKHKSGKTVFAWAFEGDCDATALRSNTFTIEWPPRSGKQREFPEVDRADFFALEEAREKMHPAEFRFVERLHEILAKK